MIVICATVFVVVIVLVVVLLKKRSHTQTWNPEADRISHARHGTVWSRPQENDDDGRIKFVGRVGER